MLEHSIGNDFKRLILLRLSLTCSDSDIRNTLLLAVSAETALQVLRERFFGLRFLGTDF